MSVLLKKLVDANHEVRRGALDNSVRGLFRPNCQPGKFGAILILAWKDCCDTVLDKAEDDKAIQDPEA